MEIKTLKKATDTVYAELEKINSDISKDDVYDTILDEILESMEYMMTDDDVRFLEDNEDNMEAVDDLFQTKLPNYHELLTEIVEDMVSDEALA